MKSRSKKAHSGKTKRELIEDLEHIESLLNAYSTAPESDERSSGWEAEESRLSDFLESAACRFFECDARLRVNYISRHTDQSHPPIPAPGQGDSLREFFLRLRQVPVADSGADSVRIDQVLAARTPFRDFSFRMQDAGDSGGIISASGKPILDTAGEFQGYRGTIIMVREGHPAMLATTQDISDRKAAVGSCNITRSCWRPCFTLYSAWCG